MAAAKSLHIAWVGPAPGDDGGVGGVATDLLNGLVGLGHRIDCFFPSAGLELPDRLTDDPNLTIVWGTSKWQWNRWYSRTKIGMFASGMLSRALASVRQRREIERRHATEPYDLIYQFSAIETLAMPSGMAREVPLVIHPATHMAGELRLLIAERQLSWRCQPRYMFAIVAAITFLRTRVQRRRIRPARLLICISRTFRDHVVRDYQFPEAATVVVPNPVRIERFASADLDREAGEPATVLVLGRVSVRKGIEDVVAIAKALRDRDVHARVRVVGGPSLWSDYTKLLEDLPSENSEFVGSVPSSQIPGELQRSDVLLQASKYEPFALTVAEALAAGVPVVASTEVGAVEDVDRSVAAALDPGDVEGMTKAITAMLDALQADPKQVRSLARAEAERLFAPDLVCAEISLALQRLVADSDPARASSIPAAR